jgi:hypothetical protein
LKGTFNFLKKIRPGKNREIFASFPSNNHNQLSARHLQKLWVCFPWPNLRPLTVALHWKMAKANPVPITTGGFNKLRRQNW